MWNVGEFLSVGCVDMEIISMADSWDESVFSLSQSGPCTVHALDCT